MPTEALESILYRHQSKTAGRDIISVASPLLQELVNHGTHPLVRCATSVSGTVDEDLAVLAPYRQGFEMTDGIEVLISESCPAAAITLLRTSFETLLAIEYSLESENEYVRGSLAWLVGYHLALRQPHHHHPQRQQLQPRHEALRGCRED